MHGFVYNRSMFNSLTGIITAKLPQTVYLENAGIEWDISVPDSSIDSLPHVGEKARLFTWLLHREDSMKLFGFASAEDRALFLDLLKVEGVGPKAALKILSSVSTAEMVKVLDAGDVAVLEKLPGVGKKTAQKMMLALKGKLTLLEENQQFAGKREKSSPWNDVIVALTDMGYDRKRVEETVERLAAENKEKLSDMNENKALIEEQLFRQAIVELAK